MEIAKPCFFISRAKQNCREHLCPLSYCSLHKHHFTLAQKKYFRHIITTTGLKLTLKYLLWTPKQHSILGTGSAEKQSASSTSRSKSEDSFLHEVSYARDACWFLKMVWLEVNTYCSRKTTFRLGGYLGQFLLGMCRWPLRAPTPW